MPDTLTLRIELMHVKPKVIRTFKVSSNSSMYELHFIVQRVMGWNDSHLHRFEVGDVMIQPKDPYGFGGFDDFGETKDSSKVKVGKVFAKVGSKAKYEYDFGDGWMHKLELVERSESSNTEVLPVVVSGKNACPPDDSGGPWGYMALVDILKDPQHKYYNERKEWVDAVMGKDKFNPKKYSVEAVNERLVKMYEEE